MFMGEEALDRGTRTLERILIKAGPKAVRPLQTSVNEVDYLMAAARLAIEALGIPAEVTEARLHAARLRGLSRMAELRKAAEPVLETGEVCQLLGVSPVTIRKKVDRHQLLALPKGGDRVFPAFQFKNGDVLPGIAEVLVALDTPSAFTALSFLLSKSPDWDNQTAIKMLEGGQVDRVVAEARVFLSHGA